MAHGALKLSLPVAKEALLSDGTFLPAGVDVAVNAMEVNRREELWKNADVFDGFRFDKLRQEPGAESKYQLIKSELVTSLQYLRSIVRYNTSSWAKNAL